MPSICGTGRLRSALHVAPAAAFPSAAASPRQVRPRGHPWALGLPPLGGAGVGVAEELCELFGGHGDLGTLVDGAGHPAGPGYRVPATRARHAVLDGWVAAAGGGLQRRQQVK